LGDHVLRGEVRLEENGAGGEMNPDSHAEARSAELSLESNPPYTSVYTYRFPTACPRR
jgi:hypothetical protein